MVRKRYPALQNAANALDSSSCEMFQCLGYGRFIEVGVLKFATSPKNPKYTFCDQQVWSLPSVIHPIQNLRGGGGSGSHQS